MKLLRQDAIEDYSRGYVSFINQILEITKNNNIDLVIIRDAWVVGKNMAIKVHPRQKLCMYDATFEGAAVYFMDTGNNINNCGEVFFYNCDMQGLKSMKHNCDVTNVVEVQQYYLNSTILPVSPPSGTVQTLSIDELNKNLIVVPKLQCSNKSLNDWVKSISEDLMVLDIKLFTAGFEVRMEYRIGGLEIINYYSGKSFNSLQDINTLSQYKKNNDNKDEDDDVIILGDNLGDNKDEDDDVIILGDNKVEENAGVTITGDNFII